MPQALADLLDVGFAEHAQAYRRRLQSRVQGLQLSAHDLPVKHAKHPVGFALVVGLSDVPPTSVLAAAQVGIRTRHNRAHAGAVDPQEHHVFHGA